MYGHTTDSMCQNRNLATAAAATDFQRLVALGPSRSDWQSDLESEAARLTGTPHVIAVASANVALHCVLAAHDLQAGDEVIIPAYVPPSIPEVVRQFNAHPVLVDIVAESAHIDVHQAADAVTDRTRAIVAVDIAGLPVDIRPLNELCQLHGLLLVNDAQSREPGIGKSFDLIENQVRINHCRSNEAGLLCSGALISTTDPTIAECIRRQLKPFDEPVCEPQQWNAKKRSLHYADRMTGLAAAWQLIAFGKARKEWQRRCRVAVSYTAAFCCRCEYQVPFEWPDTRHGWLDYPLRLNLQHLSVTRDEFTSELRRRGVKLTVPYLPINLMPGFQELYGFGGDTFPLARNEFMRRVCLPIDSWTSDADVDRIINVLMDFADELQRRRETSLAGR